MTGGPFRSLHVADAVTYASLACALVSMDLSLGGHVARAAFFWCASAILDNVDGRFASLFQRSPDQRAIGAQLDSLTDVVAFGVAPAAGVLAWIAGHAPVSSPLAVACCLAYLACAVLRLAHFNVRHADGLDDFVGLPSTEAGFLVAVAFLVPGLTPAILLAIVVTAAVAMVTPIAFRRPTWTLILPLLLLMGATMVALYRRGM